MSDGDQRSIWDRAEDAEEVLAARFEQLRAGLCAVLEMVELGSTAGFDG
jgi:hypothetical protein